ncbi:MAG TPA: hypothetical protein VI547_04575 [Anaerolineales bacterium]|nr:hypothetical protein [Anaerolineales bacterium]
MNLTLILRDSWRITWKNWPLWALAAFTIITLIPAGTLSAVFSTLANAPTFDNPYLSAYYPQWPALTAQLQTVPPIQWVGFAAVTLALVVITTSATLILQAASMRGVVIAAEKGTVSLGESLRLGRARTINLVKLSAVFGLVTALLGVLPSLALLLIGDKSPVGVALIHFAQTSLTPVTIALNILTLLLIMSIALEDFSPRKAFGRAGNVFKTGWWAFLIVAGLSSLAAVIAALIFAVPVFITMPVAFFSPEAGILLTGLGFVCGGLTALFFILFTGVFTQALYALVYREAARLTAPTQ